MLGRPVMWGRLPCSASVPRGALCNDHVRTLGPPPAYVFSKCSPALSQHPPNYGAEALVVALTATLGRHAQARSHTCTNRAFFSSVQSKPGQQTCMRLSRLQDAHMLAVTMASTGIRAMP